jgi:hypothetical protein
MQKSPLNKTNPH